VRIVVLLYCDQGLVFVSLGETFNQEKQNENVIRYEIDAKIWPDCRLSTSMGAFSENYCRI